MRKGGNNIKLLFLVILSITLSGCSPFYYTYFRNFSGKPVDIILVMDDYDNQSYFSTVYRQEILPVNKKTIEYLTDTLSWTKLSDHKMSVTIPANSTVLFKPFPIKGIIYLQQENKLDSISMWSNKSNNKRSQFKHKAYSLPVIHYYDYK